jgi:hypothetical protein
MYAILSAIGLSLALVDQHASMMRFTVAGTSLASLNFGRFPDRIWLTTAASGMFPNKQQKIEWHTSKLWVVGC